MATSLSGDARRLWWAKHDVMGWYGHFFGVVMLGGYGEPDTLLWGGMASYLGGDARRLWWAKNAVMGWYGHFLGW